MFYKDYFDVSKDVPSCMTREAINREPRTWMQFYPHETFVKLLSNLLQSLNGGDKSIWLTGAYGTGKSHAALVLQKLFMDDESRVLEWLANRSSLINDTIRASLLAQRKANVFVVFDTQSDGITTPAQFLVRIENSIIRALQERGCKIPVFGSLEKILERIKEEESSFFRKRDEMQDRLSHLTPDIKTCKKLQEELSKPELQQYLLSDVMEVLHARDIYISLNSENLIKWINEVMSVNGISKMVFIWDEFSSYIDQNKSQLKTFEEVAEMAQEGKFFFMPVTHMQLESYLASGSQSAKKANDRFIFQELEMPTNTALLLAADAFRVKNADWKNEQADLWHTIKPVVTNYMAQKDDECKDNPENFEGILPIHPMTAFVLKFLASNIGSNQRSMFNFLKGENGESEFQQFIAKSGPDIKGRQFLTVDYLWNYFIERSDLGQSKLVSEVRIEYTNKSQKLSEEEKRVFKAVLLYSLLGHTANSGHELIQPLLENVKHCFDGDDSVGRVEDIAKGLEEKHCFSIINNRCEMFRAAGNPEDVEKQKEKLKGQFVELFLNQKAAPKLESRVKTFKDKLHYEARVSNVDKAMSSCQKTKDSFGETGNKILLQFIIAQNDEEQLRVTEKAKELAEQWKGYRMLFVTFPELHFCIYKSTNWDEYVEQLARYELATDATSKATFNAQINLMDTAWLGKLVLPSQKMLIYKPNKTGETFVCDCTWTNMEAQLKQYIKESFECFVDDLSGYNMTAMTLPGTGHSSWAKCGIDFTFAKGANQSVVGCFSRQGISNSSEWFTQNPQHPLAKIHDFCRMKLNNALNGSTGTCSIRKILIDLQRPPYAFCATPFTAFVMGYVMRDWLNNPRQQLQWTNGQMSDRLDIDTLSEMIGEAVKDNGNNAIKNEKLICRISQEEKKFIECARDMFGVENLPNATVEGTLGLISARLERISNKVPLWVLPDYIASKEEPQADNCRIIINKLCDALKISSKGNQQERTTLIKEIGTLLAQTDGLAGIIGKYVQPKYFEPAFIEYVDQKKPDLQELAESAGDVTKEYCKTLKESHFSATTSWLWNPQNVEEELELVGYQYKIISVIQKLVDVGAYFSFDEAIRRVNKAMFEDNKIAVALLSEDNPIVNRTIQALESSKVADGIKNLESLLKDNQETLKKIFFDPAKQVQIAFLKKHFKDQLQALSDSELQDLYGAMSLGAKRTSDDFTKTALQEIDDYLKKSTTKQILLLWKQKTDSDTPEAWSLEHKMPVTMLFATGNDAASIIPILENTSAYQSSALKKCKEKLESVTLVAPEALNEHFVNSILPKKYRSLPVNVADLCAFLCEKVGKKPNSWSSKANALNEAVEAYIRNCYKELYKEKAVGKVQTMSENDAKKLLLKFVENNPDVGLEILE